MNKRRKKGGKDINKNCKRSWNKINKSRKGKLKEDYEQVKKMKNLIKAPMDINYMQLGHFVSFISCLKTW